jgi:RNA polymerase sigma-70 factor (ECF subfamily)
LGKHLTPTAANGSAADHVLLVREAQRGDARAFEGLYARFGRYVHGLLLSRVPADAASDLAQDVFLQAWRTIGSLRDPRAFGGWIGTIARTRAIDYLRAARPTAALEHDVAAADRPDLTFEAQRALDAIRTLPEAYRDTLMLRLVEGCSGAEIAALTGLTPDSVRVNLHRGFKLLREKLQ